MPKKGHESVSVSHTIPRKVFDRLEIEVEKKSWMNRSNIITQALCDYFHKIDHP